MTPAAAAPPHPFAERFAAAAPGERAALVAAFLPGQAWDRPLADMLWKLRLADQAGFDEGLDEAAAKAPAHRLVAELLAWREQREERHDRVKALAEAALRREPGARTWRLRLARSELLAPSADPARREANWRLALAGVPEGLPRLALLAQRAIAEGLSPDLSAFDAALAREAEAILRPPPAPPAPAKPAGLIAALARALPHRRQPDAAPPPATPQPEAEAERLAAILRTLQAARDVALVGNAPTLAGSGAGPQIDRHDLVVRCNYPKLRRFAPDVGRRADLVLFHGAKRGILPRMLARDPRYPSLPAFSSGPPKLPLAPPPDAEPRPAVPPALERLADSLSYAERTTGLFGAVLIGLVLGRPLRLYGFDFFRPGSAGHYYGKASAAPHHDLAYERWFLTRALPALRPAVTLHASAGG
jgi:hypothetical protein